MRCLAYVIMVYVVMACIVMAYMVMACIVMPVLPLLRRVIRRSVGPVLVCQWHISYISYGILVMAY